MPGWLKALLIIAILVVLLVVGVIAAGIYWWTQNKDALIAKGKAVVTEGRDFGRRSDNQGCVDQAISRYKNDPGFGSTISTSIFMQACLENSRPTPGFCDEVPRQTEFVKSAQWRLSQCRRVDLANDNNCHQLFAPVQKFCEEQAQKGKVGAD